MNPEMDTFSEIYLLCTRELALILDIDSGSIPRSATFPELGLDSAMAVHFILAVEEKLQIELDPDILDQHPTVDSFCEYLARRL